MKKMIFNLVSRNKNAQGKYTLEPVEAKYASSFDASDGDELEVRLDGIGNSIIDSMGIDANCFDVGQRLPDSDLLAPYSLADGGVADDVVDIRDDVELPSGIASEDCRYFVLYPSNQEDRERHPVIWLVLRPQLPEEVVADHVASPSPEPPLPLLIPDGEVLPPTQSSNGHPSLTTEPELCPVDIPIDQFDLTEAGRLREDDNLKLVAEYAEVFRQNMENGKLLKSIRSRRLEFINRQTVAMFLQRDGIEVLVAKEAGVAEVPCIIFSSKTAAFWYGLGDNQKNGERNKPGDLKKMVGIALQQYQESHRVIAEHIGCSATYVNKIVDELQTSLHLPQTRTGRDGEQHPTRRPKRQKKEEGATDTTKNSPEQESPHLANDDLEEDKKIGTSGETDIQTDSETTLGNDQRSTDKSAATKVVPPDSRDDESFAIISSSGLQDVSDETFADKFEQWIKHLPINDEKRLTLFLKFIKKLLNGFKDRKYSSRLKQEVGEWVAPATGLN